jgi:amino acid adenylation domain-containing protein
MPNELQDDPVPSLASKRALAARLLRARAALARRAPACIHRIFEAHATLTPGAVALTCDDRATTYGELNARANRLARRLRALGVRAEVPVGVLADRSLETVVGLLAVLKAGGAYVPLDPAYPSERIAFLLSDSRVRVVLCRSDLRDGLPEHGASVVDLDDDCESEREDDLPGGAAPGNAAYVIYTSGSTGRPKGVVVTHSSVTHLLAATQAWYDFGASDVWTLFHSFAFDFSVWELWGALTFGGRLVVVPYWVSRSPEAFHALLRSEQVTVLNQTPSAFRQLVRADEAHGGPGDDLALRLVIFGGEALELETLRPWFDRHGARTPQLVNMYGITETTVHVTCRPVSLADLDGAAGTSPIGVPIPGWRVLLLDRHLQPVPVGVVGEIHVGGRGLARGYLGRPGLTADRFVADPFSGEPGARLYRSGDLARRRLDGSLEYLGRSDHQVKVRGFRVELGEIEAALLKHPGVREAVVLAREFGAGDTRLVAYVVARGDTSPCAAELRRWLKPRLPEYMVPSAFVPLDALPLTHHGKIDRDALPLPGPTDPVPGDEPPRTPVEGVVASVWAEVLGAERVGRRDDFFDLGGHSLLGTQVVSRLRDALGVEVLLRALFEAPTVAGLAERIEAERSGDRRSAAGPVVPVPRDGPAPVSFAQEALWFLDQLDPGRPTFNVSAGVRVSGPLDLPALERAFAEIVARHEALRTTFATADGLPVQVIAQAGAAVVERIDLTALPETERLAEAERRAVAESRRPFDLARGPLARAVVIRLAEKEHAIVLTMHHIVTDGWSFGVAARELAALYQAFLAGAPSPLPGLPVQYADYAVWQRDRLRGEALDGLLGYWTGRLSGVPPLELPTDRPRPAVRTARGAEHFFRLPAALAGSIRALARREGATPFMTLLAAFQALLFRYSGQEDFVVGSPVANRNRAEVEGLIGYFINMLALRADLSGGPTFRTLLSRVRAESLGAFENQDLPFEKLVEALQPGRDLSRTPLFQVMFVFQNHEIPDPGRSDLTLAPLETGEGTGTAKFDLTLAMADDGPEMAGSFEYDADLFDPATIARMVEHFVTLLETVAAEPGRRVSELSLLPAGERDQVLNGWNRTDAPVPPGARVHRLFEAQAARSPDAIAVEAWGLSLSYRELDALANRLAHRLRRLGVGPGARVAIAVERSADLAVGLLGILKAGGAYVPLDPAYPRDRLSFMLDDARVSALLTQRRLRDLLPSVAVPVIELDRADVPDEPDSSPDADVSPDDPAYVIYTSGSTGAPRGVVVTHGGLVNHTLAAAALFELGPDDRVLQFASLSFDIAVEELFPAWSRGATVVLRGGDETLEPARFSRWVEEKKVTVLDLPTAYWHAWVSDLAAKGETLPRTLRLVVVGGERALPGVYAKWQAIGGERVRWLNTYGPTEATVIATADEPVPGEEVGQDLPIGRPIANTRVYLLDARRQPVPVGVPGELYIGGAGVARGYLGRPGLTADRFVADAFSGEPGARLFRTGDRARWRADGRIEFLGRFDEQVKVRGHRVEPAEVEAALRAHPGVRAAVVVARTGADGENRLDAYVVPEGDGSAPADDLRRFLRERLPRPLIPSTFTTLATLPLTPSGKVDRRSLPPPDKSSTGRADALVAPRDDVEARLAALWEGVLDLRPVGVTDSFFDLGGHSLLAIRLLARVEEEFGRRLALSALFLGPTVEEMAALLRDVEARPAPWSPLVPVQRRGDKPPFFCVHPAGGIVYCFQELAQRLGPDRPFLAFQSAGLDGEREPFAGLEEMAACYVEALRAAQPRGPYHLGGWSLGGLVAFEMARQVVGQGGEIGTLALIDTRAPSTSWPVVPESLKAVAREVAGLGLLGPDDLAADPLDDALVVAEFAGDLTRDFGGDARRLIGHLKGLAPGERQAFLLKALGLDQVYSQETGPERVARLWTVLRANLLAGVRYRPGPYPGRAVLFRAGATENGRAADPTLGWSRLAVGGVTTYTVPGDHAGMLRAPGVAVLAEALRAEMDRGAS